MKKIFTTLFLILALVSSESCSKALGALMHPGGEMLHEANAKVAISNLVDCRDSACVEQSSVACCEEGVHKKDAFRAPHPQEKSGKTVVKKFENINFSFPTEPAFLSRGKISISGKKKDPGPALTGIVMKKE